MTCRTYSLNDVELKSLKKFQNKHYKLCKSGTSVTFTETGISKKIEVCCHVCKKVKDISDYASW